MPVAYHVPLAILAAAPVLSVAVPASADEVQDRVVAAARSTRPDGYAFRSTTVIDRTGSARRILVEQYDPRRPADARWSLVSVDGHAPAAAEADRFRKAKHGPVPSYASLARWFGAPATRAPAGPGHVLYRFAALPAGTLKLGSHDASADTQAEALVNVSGAVPVVERVRLSSAKPFRMMLVASVSSMLAATRYAPLPGGGMVPVALDTRFAGSMLGKSGEIATATTYADFQPVP